MEDEVVVIGPKKTPKSSKIYKCSKCSYQTNRAYNVQRHLAKHYEKPPKELQHICPYAGCSFSTLRWDNLNRHMQRLHRITKPKIEDSTNTATTEEATTAHFEEEPEPSDEDLGSVPSVEYPVKEEYPEEEYHSSVPEEEYPVAEEDLTSVEDDLASIAYDEDSVSVPTDEITETQSTNTDRPSKVAKQSIGKQKRNYQKGKTKSYECNSCSYRTNRCYNIKRHIVKHMENPSEGVLLHVCIISGCKFVTPRWDNLCRHVKRIHPESETTETDA